MRWEVIAVGAFAVAATVLASLIATLATTTTVPKTTALAPFTTEATAEPAPIAGQGYSKVFDDEFDALDPANWMNVWYNAAPPADTVFVSAGLLHLVSKRRDGFPPRGVDTRGTTNGGPDSHYSSAPMYVEASMKMPQGAGAWPALWMTSSEHAWSHTAPCPTLNAEVDVFEGWHTALDASHTLRSALHRNTGGWCGTSDTQVFNGADVGYDMSQRFHTYSVLVRATDVRFYVDDVLYTTFPSYDSTAQSYLFYVTSSACNPGNSCANWHDATDASTPDDLDVQVDWFRVWTR
jgi:hypothetical protein